MSITETLEQAGWKPEKSDVGDKFILEGIYRAAFFDVAGMEDNGYGESVYAQFKIQETLAGHESRSNFPEFRDYYSCAPDSIGSKRKGLAKLLNGLFSVGIDVDLSDAVTSKDVATKLDPHKGALVFIKGYKKDPRKLVNNEWVEDPDGEVRQGFTFLTEANAIKLAEKAKGGKPF